MSVTEDAAAAELRRAVADLQRERDAALEQQTAIAEVLHVINASPGDLAPVFDAILEKAIRLCQAAFGVLFIADGDVVRAAHSRKVPTAFKDYLEREPPRLDAGSLLGRTMREQAVLSVADLRETVPFRERVSLSVAAVELGGIRSICWVPLVHEAAPLGLFAIFRQEVRPFSEKQVALVQNFADQAVIAMENARLLGELRRRTGDLREALDYQTATSDVLKVISRSNFDLDPVFQVVVDTATRLCHADQATIYRYQDGAYRWAACTSMLPEYERRERQVAIRPGTGTLVGRVALERRVVQILDAWTDPLYEAGDDARAGGVHTMVGVPLLLDGAPIGVIGLARRRIEPYTQRQIDLVSTFADQAVIAIANARLLTEQQEALEHQTATAEVLQVINASPGDLTPVFEAILEKAHTLCGATYGGLLIREGEALRVVAAHGEARFVAACQRLGPVPPPTGSAVARLVAGEIAILHVADVTADDGYAKLPAELRNLYEIGGIRTLLMVSLRKDGEVLGAITAFRQEVRPFSDKQIALLENFAAQSVIAIENARLLGDLRQRTRDLQESLEYQTATSDVLKVISQSTFDLTPVLERLLQTAAMLCDADLGSIAIREGDTFRMAANHNPVTPEYDAYFRNRPMPADRGSVTGRTVLEGRIIHVADVMADPDFALTEAVRHGGARTVLGVPLLREGVVAGVIILGRKPVQPFADRQIELVTTFADQAVIAIENTRLLTGQREALEQQTATAEVLGIINANPGDLAPVFDAILDKAHRICGATVGSLLIYDGEFFHAAATHGHPERFAAFVRGKFRPNHYLQALLRGESLVHIPDFKFGVAALDHDLTRNTIEGTDVRTSLWVPLRKDGVLLGCISAFRTEVRPFSEKEIALLENFAAQAVIAMENARLLGELRRRTGDLQESLEYQTATSDVLKVISRSAFDLRTVLRTVVASAVSLCRAERASLYRYRDGRCHFEIGHNNLPEYEALERSTPISAGPETLVGRTMQERRTVQIVDALNDPDYRPKDQAELGDVRSMLGVPLLRGGELIGVFGLARAAAEKFTDRQVELVTTFADQAVIAIENARLLGELQARTEELAQRQEELRVTFENMGDGVAMFDATPRLVAWNRKFQEILDVSDGELAERRSFAEYIRYLTIRGEYGAAADPDEQVRRYTANAGTYHTYERMRPDGRVIEVRHNPVAAGGFVLIYADITARKRNEAEIRAARDAAEAASRTIDAAYRELQAAQANLIQAEKMASLGQLTAGIAHEIKNPLNFVNNFSLLSVELLDELKAAAAPALAGLDHARRAEVDEIVGMLTSNLEKITEHGRRADGIVKSMLEHSRGGSGERRSVDLDALVEEALSLAYHGARAQDQGFNITLRRDFGKIAAPIALVPQDMTRVLLNLFGNGFHAAASRRRHDGAHFEPDLTVSTRDLGDAVEIRVRDNGAGIAPDIREKLFQPFFTTKPTGEGTGLGLSISYDIVTQQHGGTITVDSEVGAWTEFTIRLPRGT